MSDSATEHLDSIRTSLVQRVLRVFALVGVFAWLPSVWVSLAAGMRLIAGFDTLVYLAVIALAVRPTAPTWLRGTVLVGVCHAIGLVMLLALGPFAIGLLWLMAAAILSAALLGRRATVLSLGVDVAILALASGVFEEEADPFAPLSSGAWGAFVANAVLLGTVCSTVVASAIGSLLTALERQRRALDELRTEADARRAAEEALRHAQRIEVIGLLAGGIAHDFNNLLLPIRVLTPGIRAALAPGSEAQEDVAIVDLAARKAEALAARLMELARRRDARVEEPVPLAPLVAEVCDLAGHSLPAGIPLDFRIAADAVVQGDRTELGQVLVNLVTNAGHAMRSRRGAVRVVLDRSEDGRAARLAVQDDGCGMDPGTVARMVEPFFTTKPPGEGTGLGMAMVDGIVRAHGGRLHVQSELGVGSTIVVELPILAGAG